MPSFQQSLDRREHDRHPERRKISGAKAGLLVATALLSQLSSLVPDAAHARSPLPDTERTAFRFHPDADHDAPRDGVTDAAAAINASLADCENSGGGTVVLGSRQYVVASADITVPIGCKLAFESVPLVAIKGATDLAQPALIRASDKTIRLYGALENVTIIETGLNIAPTSHRDVYNKVNRMSGTAVTLMAHDAQLRNIMIIGGDKCVDNNAKGRVRISDMWAHCKNVLPLDGIRDDSYIRNIHAWPFYPGVHKYYFDRQPVSAVANIGGKYRLTVPTTANLATGDRVMVYGVGGTVGANGKKTVTVLDSRTIELQASAPRGVAASGTWAGGETLVFLATLPAGIWKGSVVSGSPDIPAGATVQAIDFNKKVVRLSAPTTGAGARVPLTFADPGAYTSGGTVEFRPSMEPLETFISYTNGEESKFTNVFNFGWKKGFVIGSGAVWPEFSMASCDTWRDPERVCIELTGNPVGASFIGGQGGGTATFLNDNGRAGVTSFVGMQIRPDPSPWVQASLEGVGDVQFTGMFSTCGTACDAPGVLGELWIYQGAGRKVFTGGNMPRLDLFPQNQRTALDSLVVGGRPVFAAGSPFTYSQGLWIPALAFGGNGTGLAYGARHGRYMTEWPYQNLDFSLALNGALPAQKGDAAITGQPAVPCSATPAESGVALVDAANMTGLTGALYVRAAGGSGTLDIKQTGATGAAPVTPANFTSAATLRGTFRCLQQWVQR
ncbi:MAG: hypothetical protein AB7H90_06440 [Alphaproteobacteria bacterium]